MAVVYIYFPQTPPRTCEGEWRVLKYRVFYVVVGTGNGQRGPGGNWQGEGRACNVVFYLAQNEPGDWGWIGGIYVGTCGDFFSFACGLLTRFNLGGCYIQYVLVAFNFCEKY